MASLGVKTTLQMGDPAAPCFGREETPGERSKQVETNYPIGGPNGRFSPIRGRRRGNALGGCNDGLLKIWLDMPHVLDKVRR